VNLHKFPEIKAKVEEAMSWYIDYVKQQYPALCHIKVGALKTSPNKISQYKQHYNRLHSGYYVECKEKPPLHWPISILIGLDAFKFMYLPTKYSFKKEIVTTVVAPGQMIMITDDCLHSGGANLMDDTVYQLFAYMVNHPMDIPTNGVSMYSWTDPSSKDAVISAVSNTDEAKRMAHLEQTDLTTNKSSSNGKRNIRKVPPPDFFLKSESRCVEGNQQKRNKNRKNAKKAN
jgi:hypothetical protein